MGFAPQIQNKVQLIIAAVGLLCTWIGYIILDASNRYDVKYGSGLRGWENALATVWVLFHHLWCQEHSFSAFSMIALGRASFSGGVSSILLSAANPGANATSGEEFALWLSYAGLLLAFISHLDFGKVAATPAKMFSGIPNIAGAVSIILTLVGTILIAIRRGDQPLDNYGSHTEVVALVFVFGAALYHEDPRSAYLALFVAGAVNVEGLVTADTSGANDAMRAGACLIWLGVWGMIAVLLLFVIPALKDNGFVPEVDYVEKAKTSLFVLSVIGFLLTLIGVIIFDFASGQGWVGANAVFASFFFVLHHLYDTGDDEGEAISSWAILGLGQIVFTLDSLLALSERDVDGASVWFTGLLFGIVSLITFDGAKALPSKLFAGVKNIIASVAFVILLVAELLWWIKYDDYRGAFNVPSYLVVMGLFACAIYFENERAMLVGLIIAAANSVNGIDESDNNNRNNDTVRISHILEVAAVFLYFISILGWLEPGLLGDAAFEGGARGGSTGGKSSGSSSGGSSSAGSSSAGSSASSSAASSSAASSSAASSSEPSSSDASSSV